MKDSDEGDRSVHNNSGTIGFLGSDGAGSSGVFDDGNWWSSRNGYLSDIVNSIGTKVDKNAASNTLTGDLYMENSYPQIQLSNTDGNAFAYLDLLTSRMVTPTSLGGCGTATGDNSFYVDYIDNGVRFAVRTDGSVTRAQLGDLNTRIEDRAAAHANAAANGRLSSMRFVYAGDLGNDWNYTGGFGSPYGGYACMVDRATQPEAGFGGQFVKVLRWRYLQMYLPTTGWITVTAAS